MARCTRGLSGSPIADKKKVKILFLRSPRSMWPIINEQDNFLLPLAYPTLAAYLRKFIPDIEISIVDTMALKMGWRSLEKYLLENKPDILAIGEKTIYYKEGFRAFELAKKVLPDIINIAGGVMFTAIPKWTLENCSAIDFVVLYEGEETLKELVITLKDGRSVDQVRGLVYRDEDNIPQFTPERPLIENLDDLPLPAYDLAGINHYKPFGHLWPKAITIQRSRGCTRSCNFCTWRMQEGRPELIGDKYISHQAYRTKSPQRMVDEVEWLYRDFGIRYLFWVDATWNLDNNWLMDFCEEIFRRGIKLDGWWAFVRADELIHNEMGGVLRYMVKAGLRHVLVGAEHDSQASYDFLNKGIRDYNVTRQALRLLSEKYPQVFRQATYITGLPEDTVESIKGLVKHAHECDLDFAAFHPVAPFPGTELYELGKREGLLEEKDFAKYDMFYPAMRTYHISRAEIAAATQWCYKNFVQKKPFKYLRRMFSPYPIRRELHRWFAFAVARVILKDMKNSLIHRKRFKGFSGIDEMQKPQWYDD
ncbi:MAG: radical SAM protein [Thermodesulfobacteriota bacterium]